MIIEQLQAIDIHAHYGTCIREGVNENMDEFMSGGAECVLGRAVMANTKLTVVSPLNGLMPRHKANPIAANQEAKAVISKLEGLLQWVIIDPKKVATFEQARELLRMPKCVGIKIHPEEHGYEIKEYGEKLFKFAAEHKAVILSHSGERNSLPMEFVPFADAYPESTVIVAHLGCSWNDDPTHQVKAISASKHGNIYTDTSSSMSISPGLIEWAVSEVGAEKILYGTDSPLYFAPMQRARIDKAEISYNDKIKILCSNAERLLKLK